MFTALISIFKAAPEPEDTLEQANEALQQRMNQMLRYRHLAPRLTSRETYSTDLLKRSSLDRYRVMV